MMPDISFFLTSGASKKVVIALIFFVCASSGFSQKDLLQQADKLVAEKRYGEAIPLYDKVYEKKKDRSLLLKMADANFLNDNYPQAQKQYAEYFQDSVYEHIPQFTNYAKSAKLSGKIALAVSLYQKLYSVTQDSLAKETVAIYKLYVDSAKMARSYDLDSNFKCVSIDASESIDTLASPMYYIWEFDDGKTTEGTKIEHCFTTEGEHSAILNITDKRSGMVRQRDTMLVIYVEPLPVKFSAPKKGRRYFFIDFDASATDIAGYEILDYVWDMDNGETNNGKKIKYKYNDSRDYWVRLTVIAKNKTTGRNELFSANKKIEILENYEMPNKKFSDSLNGAK